MLCFCGYVKKMYIFAKHFENGKPDADQLISSGFFRFVSAHCSILIVVACSDFLKPNPLQDAFDTCAL